MKRIFCWLSAIVILSCQTAWADDSGDARAEYIRSHYAKYEYRVPMRDGKTLFTSVYIPYDHSRKYPILMQRTPYRVAPYGAGKYKTQIGPTEAFEKEGFIFVFQDVRGKFMSEGQFVNMRPQDAEERGGDAVDDATDTYDTIEWLVNNLPYNNGKVGMLGTSYPGYYSTVGVLSGHPALKAVSPQAPIANWFFDDFHRNGAFVLPMAFKFFDFFDQPRDELYTNWPQGVQLKTPDGYRFYKELGPLSTVNDKYFHRTRPFWNDLTEHPNYDEYWQSRNVLSQIEDIDTQVLIVGGWFDTEDLYGPLKTYQAMQKAEDDGNVRIVMGPWTHGGWHRTDGTHVGDATFGFSTSKWFQNNIELPFFLHYLKGAPEPKIAEATVFETGADRWRQFSTWPPKNVRDTTWYLHQGEGLDQQPSSADQQPIEFVSDPNKPVPYTKEVLTGWAKNYMGEDQRFAASRPDVLVFESKPMEQDLTVAGEITADLWVATNRTAADWVVKVIDVEPGFDEQSQSINPDGDQQTLVRWGVIRGRFRDSFSDPKPFTPNKPTQVKLVLNDILHTFQKGHRLMVQVQSSFFPFIDRNPQTYVDNIFAAKPEDFVKATHKVFVSGDHQSRIIVPELPGQQRP
ncbi:X-Pro dipeptidyl-peptidase [Idiomarina tyrosinivorans]|uniref:X-Pro dipeptidyl-peptidase n=1 Tax=Idiomarina tyrosinivorans TaxID=1445662 RepID=A0A432ZTX1_9GAMM|nr:CocE/NonD family hydrolase [Idiomarina tyrosinivorans]RUO81333.1 X-Pro dipeptidyl-peptidase [Idiomarina tyrosinivorans]